MTSLLRLQSTAREILAESFARAIEMSCDRDAPGEFRFYMWQSVVDGLKEGRDLEYGDRELS